MKSREQKACPLGTWSFRVRLGKIIPTRTPPLALSRPKAQCMGPGLCPGFGPANLGSF